MQVQAATKNSGIINLLRCRDYTILLVANLISRFGDSLDGIAYGWMVYMLTGSRLLLGTLFAVNALPNIIFGPFAGLLADRINKKTLIILSFAGRGAAVSLTALLYTLGLLAPWHLFGITIINSTLETLMGPASTSLMPLILNKENFLAANSFSTSAYKFAELLGTGAAGLIIALVGISGAIVIDGITFFTAAVLVLFLKVKLPKIEAKALNVGSYGKELMVGFSFVKNNKLIRLTMMLFAVINFCLAPIGILMPVFTKDLLMGGPNVLSMIGISFAVGTIIGGLAMGQFGAKFKITSLIAGGFMVLGASYGLLYIPGNLIGAGVGSLVMALSCFFMLGFLIPVVSSPIQTYLISNTEQSILGRVSSILKMISFSAIPLGAAVTGIISEYLSVSAIFLIMGAAISFIALMLCFNKEFTNASAL